MELEDIWKEKIKKAKEKKLYEFIFKHEGKTYHSVFIYGTKWSRPMEVKLI